MIFHYKELNLMVFERFSCLLLSWLVQKWLTQRTCWIGWFLPWRRDNWRPEQYGVQGGHENQNVIRKRHLAKSFKAGKLNILRKLMPCWIKSVGLVFFFHSNSYFEFLQLIF